MKLCLQTPAQSVYEHGLSVWKHTQSIINILHSGQSNNLYKIPDWMMRYKQDIIDKLLDLSIIEEYTIHHDCSKPYCKVIDNEGRQHFPNHAELAYKIWLEAGGSNEAALLMKKDMMIHTMKAKDIDEFIECPEAITLLVVGLAEVHANAEMFGGLNSVSFKIKWNQINKRGKIICKKLFGEHNVVD